MAEAYRLIGGNDTGPGVTGNSAKRDYFRISFMLRSTIEKAIAEGSIISD